MFLVYILRIIKAKKTQKTFSQTYFYNEKAWFIIKIIYNNIFLKIKIKK